MISSGEGLGRQILRTMMLAAMASLLVTLFGIYVFYGVLITLTPHFMLQGDAWVPQPIEIVVVLGLCLVALMLAASVVLGLARRIVVPLNAVARGARQIAEGDLSVRADVPDRPLGEASLLVENFNVMAQRLETAASGVARWNSVIAHELRTPVTILRGRVQGMADGVFPPDEQIFTTLLAQIDGLTRLIEDLRTVSLLESGHLDWRPESVSLADQILEVLRLSAPGMADSGFVIETDLDQGTVMADPVRIRQVLLALIENARKYAVPGLLTVSLRLTATDAVIAVQDEGPGLPAEFVEEAFKPFRRGDSHHQVRGSGLGLTVVQGIAKAHGGGARYVENAGGGRFEIAFPRRSR